MLSIVAVIAGAAMSYRPWKAYVEQRRVAEGHVREVREAEARRAELARTKAKLETFAGREAVAREQGFVKANERVPQIGP